VSLAKHVALDFPVIDEAFVASLARVFIFMFAGKMFDVIAVASVRQSAGPLNGLPTKRCRT
jgi:hypothetical protein